MKIGVIVYSKTGNTYTVGRRLEEKLKAAGHLVRLARINPDEGGDGQEIDWFQTVSGEDFDAFIIGAPVEAFSLNREMKDLLKGAGFLKNKGAACFVTKGLPFNWTGGNRAVSLLKGLCLSAGAEVLGSGIVKWRDGSRERDIDSLLENFSSLF